jgi:hypothetical protein
MHNTRKGEEALKDCEVKNLEHPPYSPNLSPCDVSLFGYLGEKMKLLSCETA